MDSSSSTTSDEDIFTPSAAVTSPYELPAEERYLSSFSSYRTIESSIVTSNSVSDSIVNGPVEGHEIDLFAGGRVGLRNLGNTCFLNSTLQCLAAADELSVRLAEDLKAGRLKREKFFSFALAELFLQMWRKPATSTSFASVDPRTFKIALGRVDHRFEGYHQEDSQEALAIILDRLHEDLKQSSTLAERPIDPDGWRRYCAKEDSFIRELFHGQLRSSLTCAACGHCSQTFDPFCFLNLPFPQEKPVELPKANKSTHFTISCFSESSNSYLKAFKSFSSAGDFNSFFSGAGFCVVRPDRKTGELMQVWTRMPSSDELQTSKTKHMIAYRLDYASSNFLVTLKLNGLCGYPILISLPYSKTLTLSDFVADFLVGKLKRIVKSKYASQLEMYTSLIENFISQPELHFRLEPAKSINLFLSSVVIEALGSKEVNTLFGNLEEFFDNFSDDTLLEDEEDGDDDNQEDDVWAYRHVNRIKPSYPQHVALDDCIRTFLTQESVSAECEKCHVHGPATKKLDLWRLPPILILHLKRFSFSSGPSIYYSYSSSAGSKISSKVDFPVTTLLNLKALHDSSTHEYELFAVSQHYGSLHFGHYTAVTWHRRQNCWSLADDGHITRYSSPSEWLPGAQESAYVLFYRLKQ